MLSIFKWLDQTQPYLKSDLLILVRIANAHLFAPPNPIIGPRRWLTVSSIKSVAIYDGVYVFVMLVPYMSVSTKDIYKVVRTFQKLTGLLIDH